MYLTIALCLLCSWVAPHSCRSVDTRESPPNDLEPFVAHHHHEGNIAELLIPLLERSLAQSEARDNERAHRRSKAGKKVIQVLPYRGSEEHKRKGWRKLNSHKKQVVEITPLHGKNGAKPLAYILSAAKRKHVDHAEANDDNSSSNTSELEHDKSTSEEQQSSEEEVKENSEDANANTLREGDDVDSPSASSNVQSSEDSNAKESKDLSADEKESDDSTVESNETVEKSGKNKLVVIEESEDEEVEPKLVKKLLHKHRHHVKPAILKSATVEDDSATIENIEATMEDLAGTVEDVEATVEDIDATIEADATLERAGATVELADATVELADATVEAADATVEAADATVEAADATVEAADATVEAADATVEARTATVEDLEATEDVEATVEERAATVEDVEVTLEDQAVTVEDVEVTVEDRAATVEYEQATVEDNVTALDTIEDIAATVKKIAEPEDDATVERIAATLEADATVEQDATVEDAILEKAATVKDTDQHHNHEHIHPQPEANDVSDINHLIDTIGRTASIDNEDSVENNRRFIENNIVISRGHHESNSAEKSIRTLFNDRARDIIELIQSSVEASTARQRDCQENSEKHHDHKSYRLSFLFNK